MLTPKKIRFCIEYLIDEKPKAAAIRAGFAEKTAEKNASKLLKERDVALLIGELMTERSKRTLIDADWLLKRLADEAEADVADIYDDEGKVLPVDSWPLIWRKGLVQGMKIESVRIKRDNEEEVETTTTVINVSLADRAKRLEMIGKHVNVNAFQSIVAGPGGGAIEIEAREMSDLERVTRIAAMLKRAAENA